MQSQKVPVLSFTFAPMSIAAFVDHLAADALHAEDGYTTTYSSSQFHSSNFTWREQVKDAISKEFSAMGWTAVGTLAIGVLCLRASQ